MLEEGSNLKSKSDANVAGSDTQRYVPNNILIAGVIFGAVTWAANAERFVELISFFELFLENWRAFFRGIWSAFFDLLLINIEIPAHVKDALTLISFLLAGGALRSAFGIRAKPMFSIYEFKSLPPVIRQIAGSLYINSLLIFVMTVYVIACAPFVDTEILDHEIRFVFNIIVVCALIGMFILIVKITVFDDDRRKRKNLLKSFILMILSAPAVFLFLYFMFWAGEYLVYEQYPALGRILSNVTNVIGAASKAVYVSDPEPYGFKKFIDDFSGENFRDMLIIVAVGVSLRIFTGLSIRPLVYLIIIGIIILLIGSLANEIKILYLQYFTN